MTPEESFYRHHVFVCGNERPAGHARGCCKEKGGEDFRNYMKSRVKELGIEGVRVNMAGCLDRCELGAVMVVYPEGAWYTCASRDDVDEIISSHLQGGKIVERLKLGVRQKELTETQKEMRGQKGACC